MNENSASHYKVLVVEDEEIAAKHMLTALCRAGLECRHAPDGRIGLEALENEMFHLTLLDLTLPEVSGQEVCSHIRTSSTMPIIVVTARESFEAQMQCFRMGADDYLTKPFAPQNLVLRVMALLRRTYIYNKSHTATAPSPDHHSRRLSPASEVPSRLPGGWSRCDGCSYMGPTPRFETEDMNGRRIMACPHCGDKAQVAIGLGA